MPTISMFYGVLIKMFFMDTKKHKLVVAWMEIHQEDLMADWSLAVKGEIPLPIRGLE